MRKFQKGALKTIFSPQIVFSGFDYRCPVGLEFIKKILEIADVKIITLAPEIDGMQEFINDLVELNIKIQFGHTLADFDCCEKIMKDHEIGFTHLYNAMSGNDHRSPGVLSAALLKGKYAEIICDNIHVSKEAIKIAKKCIPGLYAITDSINASGLNDGEYIFAKNNIIKENNISGIIVGNPLNMDGSFGKSSQSIRDKAKIIEEKTAIPVCLWDERLSTVGAFNLSSELDINVSKREKDIDKFAAAFILQGALDFIQN